MILVSVGTQLPFDRLVKAVDDWALAQMRGDIIAQVGPASFSPRALKSFAFMEHEAFRSLQQSASLIVSHAGMGSIITAMELGIPIIIMARDHRLGEHRNGHQMATLRQFRHVPGVFAADDEDALINLLNRADSLTAQPQLEPGASGDFLKLLGDYLDNPPAPKGVRRLFRSSRRTGTQKF